LINFINILSAQSSRNIDKITIASEPDYPPYCTIDENGNAIGFSIDLMKAVAKQAGIELEINIGVWNEIKNQLADGQIDALPLVGRTPEREEYFDFTMPYLSLHGAIFTRKNYSKIKSIEDLKGKRILVMKGDNAEEFLIREKITDKIITYNSFQDAFKYLSQGEGDAVLTQRIMGNNLLKDEKIRNVKALDLSLDNYRQDFCFAVKKGDSLLLHKLNEALSVVISSGIYDEIYLKWFGPELLAGYTFNELIMILLYALIPILIIGVSVWIVFLRREVKRRTLKLENSYLQLEMKTEDMAEKEEQIRLLLNSTAEGIYAINTQGLCTMVNDSALKLLGYKNKTEFLGKNMHSLIHQISKDGKKIRIDECKIQKTFITGKGVNSDDEYFCKKDGSKIPVQYFSYPIRKDEKIIGTVVTFWDITMRKKSESELRKLKDELEIRVKERTAELQDKIEKLDKSQKAMLFMVEDLNNITDELKIERHKLQLSNKELESFSYSVSHDLRAPLRAINGFAQFLVEDYWEVLDDEGKRFIKTIRDSAAKMDVLISDILNLSRVSRADFKLLKVDMNRIVVEKLNEVFSDYNRDEFDIDIKDIDKAKVDRNLISLVWQNLINNAVKYSQKSEIKKIEIGSFTKNNEIIYYVKDFGAGFNQKYKNKLFGVFQRLHKESEFEGTGVGLAIVQRIILRHGGRVWAEAKLNKGATFFFSIPIIN
jgi:PAS domain S-box-containing protein